MNSIPRRGTWGSIVTILNNNFSEIEELLRKAGADIYMDYGVYETIGDLQENNPEPSKGAWAVIGETLPGYLYVYDGTLWNNLGTSPLIGNFSNYPGSEEITSAKDIL